MVEITALREASVKDLRSFIAERGFSTSSLVGENPRFVPLSSATGTATAVAASVQMHFFWNVGVLVERTH